MAHIYMPHRAAPKQESKPQYISVFLTLQRRQSDPLKGLSGPNNKIVQKCAAMTNWLQSRCLKDTPLNKAHEVAMPLVE